MYVGLGLSDYEYIHIHFDRSVCRALDGRGKGRVLDYAAKGERVCRNTPCTTTIRVYGNVANFGQQEGRGTLGSDQDFSGQIIDHMSYRSYYSYPQIHNHIQNPPCSKPSRIPNPTLYGENFEKYWQLLSRARHTRNSDNLENVAFPFASGPGASRNGESHPLFSPSHGHGRNENPALWSRVRRGGGAKKNVPEYMFPNVGGFLLFFALSFFLLFSRFRANCGM
jgi:hypothetical protein